MPTYNVAGELPEDLDLQACLQIKTGTRNDNPRGGTRKIFSFKVSEGFLILKAKIHTHATPLAENTPIFFKKSKNATQAQFVELTADNFVDSLQWRWNKITQNDMARWEAENTTAAAATTFEVFVYKPRPVRQHAVPSWCVLSRGYA